MPDAVVFAPNTHELLVRLFAAASSEMADPSADQRRRVPQRPAAVRAMGGSRRRRSSSAFPPSRSTAFPTVSSKRRESGSHDFIFVSQVLFGSGRRFDRVDKLAELARPEGPWVVIDGYHAFMALETPFGDVAASSAFYVGGGYKYAMSGEGCAFLHAPPGFGERPRITGWFAEFEDLTASARARSATARTRCASWARRSMRRASTASMRSGGCCGRTG